MNRELKALDKLAKQIELDEDTDFWEIRNAHKTVEQALTTKSKKELAWEIAKKKKVDINGLLFFIESSKDKEDKYSALRNYNFGVKQERELTEEEFELLKRYCENGRN